MKRYNLKYPLQEASIENIMTASNLEFVESKVLKEYIKDLTNYKKEIDERIKEIKKIIIDKSKE